MLISLFAAMSMAMNARIIDYNTDDGFKYKLNTEEKTATLSRYSGSAKEVCIPDSITYSDETFTFTVTYLGNGCFNNCTSLTSINIPSSVTSLESCFVGCTSLTSIDIPSSITYLGYYCFAHYTSLTSINIPSSVTIMDGCFTYCTALSTVNISSSVTSLDGCFIGCTSLTHIDIPSSVSRGSWPGLYVIGLLSSPVPPPSLLPPPSSRSLSPEPPYGSTIPFLPG